MHKPGRSQAALPGGGGRCPSGSLSATLTPNGSPAPVPLQSKPGRLLPPSAGQYRGGERSKGALLLPAPKIQGLLGMQATEHCTRRTARAWAGPAAARCGCTTPPPPGPSLQILPYVYTPTVGQACQEYHQLPIPATGLGHGLYLRATDKGAFLDRLRQYPQQDIRVRREGGAWLDCW